MKKLINGIEITIHEKKKPEPIGSFIGKYEVNKKKHCYYEWQDNAFRIAEKLGIDFKNNKKYLANWLRLFKTGNKAKLDRSYSFIIDYNRSLTTEGKIKLFFWRYGKSKLD